MKRLNGEPSNIKVKIQYQLTLYYFIEVSLQYLTSPEYKIVTYLQIYSDGNDVSVSYSSTQLHKYVFNSSTTNP